MRINRYFLFIAYYLFYLSKNINNSDKRYRGYLSTLFNCFVYNSNKVMSIFIYY